MRKICISVILYLLFSPAGSLAFNDDTTHKTLTERAVSNSAIATCLKESLGVEDGIDEKVFKNWDALYFLQLRALDDYDRNCGPAISRDTQIWRAG